MLSFVDSPILRAIARSRNERDIDLALLVDVHRVLLEHTLDTEDTVVQRLIRQCEMDTAVNFRCLRDSLKHYLSTHDPQLVAYTNRLSQYLTRFKAVPRDNGPRLRRVVFFNVCARLLHMAYEEAAHAPPIR